MDIILAPFSLFVEIIHRVIDEFYALAIVIGMPNYGSALILMAICVKLLMYPLKKKYAKYNTIWKRTRAINEKRKKQIELINQERKDELEKIKEVYKKYPQFVHRKTNELYSKYGAAEESKYKYDGCLPGCLLSWIQMIIFIVLLYSVYTYKYVDNSKLLWFTNLYEKDPTYIMPILLVLLYHIVLKVGTEVNTKTNKKVKYIKYIMLLSVGCIAINLPVGVVFYWCINAILSIIYELLFSGKDERENP